MCRLYTGTFVVTGCNLILANEVMCMCKGFLTCLSLIITSMSNISIQAGSCYQSRSQDFQLRLCWNKDRWAIRVFYSVPSTDQRNTLSLYSLYAIHVFVDFITDSVALVKCILLIYCIYLRQYEFHCIQTRTLTIESGKNIPPKTRRGGFFKFIYNKYKHCSPMIQHGFN